MKKKYPIYILMLLMLSPVVLASCNDDDEEETEKSPRCAMLNFAINDIKTKKTTTLSNGVDTTVTVSTLGSKFPFTIDQINNLVYNTDSLTYGTQTSEVSVKCTAESGATIAYTKDGQQVDFTSGDTLDLTHPVVFTITSSDKKYKRDYLVTLNAYKVDPGESIWHKAPKPVHFDAMKPDYSDVAADFLQTHAADHVFAFRYPLKTNASIDRRLVVCYDDTATDSLAHVWTRLTTEPAWTEMIPLSDNPYGCPLLKGMKVIRYHGDLYAFGGHSLGGRTPAVKAFEKTFVSVDNGITWKNSRDKLSMPDELLGYEGDFDVAVDDHDFMWIVLEDGTTWKGKLNAL